MAKCRQWGMSELLVRQGALMIVYYPTDMAVKTYMIWSTTSAFWQLISCSQAIS